MTGFDLFREFWKVLMNGLFSELKTKHLNWPKLWIFRCPPVPTSPVKKKLKLLDIDPNLFEGTKALKNTCQNWN